MGSIVSELIRPGGLEDLLGMFDGQAQTSSVAQAFNVSTQTVRVWRRAYKQGGLRELADKSLCELVNRTSVGEQIMLAKTCPDCGLLLDARWFSAPKGYWSTYCRLCVAKRAARSKEESDLRKGVYHLRTKKYKHRMDVGTVDRATRHRDRWTHKDVKILAGKGTAYQKAVELGRTYGAVRNAMRRFNISSDGLPKDLSDQQWTIAFK